LRRNLVGLSQEQLGSTCGLTFQQIQKYERGINRMGASRLYQFAKVLKVPVAYFFDDMPDEVATPHNISGMNDNEQASLEGTPQNEAALLYKRETLELIRSYYRITDVKQRRKVFELIRTMAEQ
jgi:transcriptional regulator with XRE-family HTH domain